MLSFQNQRPVGPWKTATSVLPSPLKSPRTAVYHDVEPQSGLWFIRQSSLNDAVRTEGFGYVGYTPVRGDFSGDGKTDVAVFHEPTGLWFWKDSTTSAVTSLGYGGAGYVPVPEDYDGDGRADVAVYHPQTGLWYMRSSITGLTSSLGFGGSVFTAVN